MELIIAHGAIDYGGALKRAAAGGHLDCMEFAKLLGTNRNSAAFEAAIKAGQPGAARLIISWVAHPIGLVRSRATLMAAAIECGSPECMRIIYGLTKMIDPDIVLAQAAGAGQPRCMELAREWGGLAYEDAMCEAARHDHNHCMQLLHGWARWPPTSRKWVPVLAAAAVGRKHEDKMLALNALIDWGVTADTLLVDSVSFFLKDRARRPGNPAIPIVLQRDAVTDAAFTAVRKQIVHAAPIVLGEPMMPYFVDWGVGKFPKMVDAPSQTEAKRRMAALVELFAMRARRLDHGGTVAMTMALYPLGLPLDILSDIAGLAYPDTVTRMSVIERVASSIEQAYARQRARAICAGF